MELKTLDKISMGEKIRRKRESLHMTREQLAEALDVSCKFVSDIECGSKGISLKRFCTLIQVLDISADELLLGGNVRQED